jgi:hypothetical protein
MSGKGVPEGRRVNGTIRLIKLALVLSCLLWTDSASAMDRFAALSMIESGDNDFACGKQTEVSRFQIQRKMWLETTNAPISLATNAVVALAVAQMIAAKRCQQFEKQHGRPPTDFEFYVLWNAPTQLEHPGTSVRERAERFVNLVKRQ